MLKVNEIYGPVPQGEGLTAGKEVIFLRTALCNLHCIWCDTPYTWNWIGSGFSHPNKYDKSTEVHLMSTEQVLNIIYTLQTRAVVISGGEPFLQQKDLIPILQSLKERNYWIEIETNGTIFARDPFLSFFNQVNCSPKLSNSLDMKVLRERPTALQQLASYNSVNFKFVISSRADAEEAHQLVQKYGMRKVLFMPEGRTRDELLRNEDLVRRLAEELGAIFTTRLHVLCNNGQRGT